MLRLIVCSILTLMPTAILSAQVSEEERVSAEMLYNIVRFSEWPEDIQNNSHIKYDICIYSNDKNVAVVSELRKKSKEENPVHVHILKNNEKINSECHVLYLSSGNYDSLNLTEIAKLGIMTVGDELNFLQSGGQAIIAKNENKIVFGINRKMMALANIRPSSKMLNLAKRGWTGKESQNVPTAVQEELHNLRKSK